MYKHDNNKHIIVMVSNCDLIRECTNLLVYKSKNSSTNLYLFVGKNPYGSDVADLLHELQLSKKLIPVPLNNVHVHYNKSYDEKYPRYIKLNKRGLKRIEYSGPIMIKDLREVTDHHDPLLVCPDHSFPVFINIKEPKIETKKVYDDTDDFSGFDNNSGHIYTHHHS